MFGLFNMGQALQGQSPQIKGAFRQLGAQGVQQPQAQNRPTSMFNQNPTDFEGQFPSGHGQMGIGQPQQQIAPVVPEWNGPQHHINSLDVGFRRDRPSNPVSALRDINPNSLMNGGALSMFKQPRSPSPLLARKGII